MTRTTIGLFGIGLLASAIGCGGGIDTEEQPTEQVSTTQPEIVQTETEIPAGELSDDVDVQTLEMLKVMSDSWKRDPVSQQGEEE